MSKIKLLAIDLDGTTLDNNRNLQDVNKEAIYKALNNGIEIVVATGRGTDGLPNQIAALPFRYLIAKNGAIVFDRKENKEIFHRYFDKEKVLEVVKYLEPTKGILNVEDINAHYINKKNIDYKADFYVEDNYPTAILVDNLYETIKDFDLKVDKINYYALDDETYDQIYKNRFAIKGMDIAQTFTRFVDINESIVNKGFGIEKLCEILKIDKQQVASIGDNDNDLSMIEFAKYSFAVNNATELLKKHAKRIVKSNIEFGLAQTINIILNINNEGNNND